MKLHSDEGPPPPAVSPSETALKLQVVVLREFINGLCDELKRFADVFEEVENLTAPVPPEVKKGMNFNQVIQTYESDLIERALTFCRGNQREAADLLGLKPTTLSHKIKQLKIRAGNHTAPSTDTPLPHCKK